MEWQIDLAAVLARCLGEGVLAKVPWRRCLGEGALAKAPDTFKEKCHE
jgi:hypothetical protein